MLIGCRPATAAPARTQASAPSTPSQDDPAALMTQADSLAASGKFSEAAGLYHKAAQSYQASGNSALSATASEKEAGAYEKLAAQLTANGKTAAVTPAPAGTPQPAPTAAPAPPRPVKLVPLKPRPHWVIGRAVFADGRPIANFQVQIGKLYGNAKAQGTNGHYAYQVTDPSLSILSLTAYASVPYRGQIYLLHLYPADGISADYYKGDVTKGVVRDFVLKLSGNVPQPPGQTPLDALDAKRSDVWTNTGFYGFAVEVQDGTPAGGAFAKSPFQAHSTFEVTLVPTGPLADGSTGAVIHRTIKDVAQIWGSFNVYDIPLGVYSVSVRVTGPDGVPHPLKLRAWTPGTTFSVGGDGTTPYTLDQVTLTVPPPDTLESLYFAEPVVVVQLR